MLSSVVRQRLIALAALTMVTGPVCSAQVTQADARSTQATARSTILALAESMGKSVIFDRQYRDRDVAPVATDDAPQEALWHLLDENDLYTIEVAGVLIVAPDTIDARHYYTAGRIANATVNSERDDVFDIVFRNTPVHDILRALAKSIGREVIFEKGAEPANNSMSLDLRRTTGAGAISVLCLVLHLSVRDNGTALSFRALDQQR